MSHNKYQGYYCLSWTSWLLLILSLGLVAFGYVLETKTIPIPIDGIERYASAIETCGGVLAVWSFLGICSICGGCLIYFHAIASCLLSIVFLVLGGLLIYIGFLTVSDYYSSLYG